MKSYFVVNPSSANGQTGRRWPKLEAELKAALGDFDRAFTEHPMHAAELTRRALEEGAECVVAVGGDGTLNEVVNGFFLGGRPVSPRAALGLLPLGTGGDFRRTFGWDTALSSAIERLKSPRTVPLDVGLLEYTTPEGGLARRCFVNVCSFGVSGQVDLEVNRGSKLLGGKLSFALGSLKALLKYSDQKVNVSFDGGAPEELWITTLAVANGRYFGGGMMVAPDAQATDGQLDVTIWSGYGLSDFIFRSRHIYRGTHLNLPGTRTLRCQEMKAESGEEVLIDLDGEQPGRLPCSLRILPGAIPLKV